MRRVRKGKLGAASTGSAAQLTASPVAWFVGYDYPLFLRRLRCRGERRPMLVREWDTISQCFRLQPVVPGNVPVHHQCRCDASEPQLDGERAMLSASVQAINGLPRTARYTNRRARASRLSIPEVASQTSSRCRRTRRPPWNPT